jgi:putative ABC transport system permease protein
MHETMVGDVRTGLYLVLAAVGTVLLIACVNLANLLLVRGSARRREMAIRTALGAGGRRLLRQAMVESLCLAVVGGSLGVAVAYRVVDVFVRYSPVSLPRLAEVGVDGNVLAFAAAVSLLCALLFGLAPAWRSARVDPQEALQTGVRSGGDGTGGHRLRSVLVGAEVALSSMLLVVAGLLVHSFMRVMSRDTGLGVRNVVAVEITLPPTAYGDADPTRRTAAYSAMLDRVARLPGVSGAAAVSQLPLTREYELRAFLPREAVPIPWMERPMANQRWITPGYFDASGIQLRSGRTFREDDREGRPIVISETVAKTFWPGQNAVGREMRDYTDKPPFLRVVGVAADVPVASLEKDSAMVVYAPYWDEPQLSMAIVVRTAMDPAGLASSIRKAVWEVEPEVPVPEPKTMRRLVSESVGARRFNLALVALFAATALSLACLGIYGLLSYSVAQRTGEIGVRLAFGARAVDIGLLVLRRGMLPVIVGLAIGLAVAVGFSRLLASMLFEVAPLDAATFLAAPALLVVVALAACLIPAFRAARIPPMLALRYE